MNTELDLQVARLMGWREMQPGNWEDVGIYWIVKNGETKTSTDDNSLFCPSGKAGHADLILDRIAALGWMVTVYTGPYKDQGIKCRCCIMRGPQDFVLGGVDVVADTRPMAISKAFVQAMERWGDETQN